MEESDDLNGGPVTRAPTKMIMMVAFITCGWKGGRGWSRLLARHQDFSIEEAELGSICHFELRFEISVVSFNNITTFIQKLQVEDPGNTQLRIDDQSKCIRSSWKTPTTHEGLFWILYTLQIQRRQHHVIRYTYHLQPIRVWYMFIICHTGYCGLLGLGTPVIPHHSSR